MRHVLAFFLLLAISVLPTLGTPHAHTPHGESVVAVQHAHGIGLDHDHEAPAEQDEAGGPACDTQNLAGDRFVLVGRVSASAPISSRAAVGWQPRPATREALADRQLTEAVGLSINGPPLASRDQVGICSTAPRRGPPQPSV